MTATLERRPLTDRQREVYDWIVAYIEAHGYSPTIRQIKEAFGWHTPNAVMCHLHPLRKKGWVIWQDGESRTLRPIGGDA